MTKNQHFVSQVEQRLNAINPLALPEKQRIYEFEIVDRERREVRLTDEGGRPISSSLSMTDLFSFDVDDAGVRMNFEQAFERYENKIRDLTSRLLRDRAASQRAIAIDQDVVFNLFVAKIINFVRNPYSVAKVLNTLGAMAQHHPTDPIIYAAYERILRGRRPHQAYLCQKLGITDEQYEAWLRALFMLLTPLAASASPPLEWSLRSLFLDRGKGLFTIIHTYSVERCLLSDRGITSPVEQAPDRFVCDFNLNAHAFIRYAFVDYDLVLKRPMPPIVKQGLMKGPKQVFYNHRHDDLAALNVFHLQVIAQSFKSAFCSGQQPYGVVVIP